MKSFYKIILITLLSVQVFPQISLRYALLNYLFEQKNNSVVISSLEVNVKNRSVYLSWLIKNEDKASKLFVERMYSRDMKWNQIAEINSVNRSLNNYEDKKLEAGFYSYRIKIVDNEGNTNFSKEVHTEIDMADSYELSQNYPNPFNPSTTITYTLPEKSFVTLKIFNVLGNEIATLINEEKSAGVYRIKFDVTELKNEISNGTYFYRLKVGEFTKTKKMIYMK